MESSPEKLLQMICSVQEEDERLSKQIMEVRAEITSIKEHIEDNKNRSASTAARISVLDKEIEDADKELQCERIAYLGMLEVYKEAQKKEETEEETLLQAYRDAIFSMPSYRSTHPPRNEQSPLHNGGGFQETACPFPLEENTVHPSEEEWRASLALHAKEASGFGHEVGATSAHPIETTTATLCGTRPSHKIPSRVESSDEAVMVAYGSSQTDPLASFTTMQTTAGVFPMHRSLTLEAAIAWARTIHAEGRKKKKKDDDDDNNNKCSTARQAPLPAGAETHDETNAGERKRHMGTEARDAGSLGIPREAREARETPMAREGSPSAPVGRTIPIQEAGIQQGSTVLAGPLSMKEEEDHCERHAMNPFLLLSCTDTGDQSSSSSIAAREEKPILSFTKKMEGIEEWPAAALPSGDDPTAAAEADASPLSSGWSSSSSFSFSVAPRKRTMLRLRHAVEEKGTHECNPSSAVSSPPPVWNACAREWKLVQDTSSESSPPVQRWHPETNAKEEKAAQSTPPPLPSTAPLWEDTWLEGLPTTSDLPWETTPTTVPPSALAFSRTSSPITPVASLPPRTRRKTEKVAQENSSCPTTTGGAVPRRGGKTITFVDTPELEMIRGVSGKNTNRVADYPTTTTSSSSHTSSRRRTTMTRLGGMPTTTTTHSDSPSCPTPLLSPSSPLYSSVVSAIDSSATGEPHRTTPLFPSVGQCGGTTDAEVEPHEKETNEPTEEKKDRLPPAAEGDDCHRRNQSSALPSSGVPSLSLPSSAIPVRSSSPYFPLLETEAEGVAIALPPPAEHAGPSASSSFSSPGRHTATPSTKATPRCSLPIPFVSRSLPSAPLPPVSDVLPSIPLYGVTRRTIRRVRLPSSSAVPSLFSSCTLPREEEEGNAQGVVGVVPERVVASSHTPTNPPANPSSLSRFFPYATPSTVSMSSVPLPEGTNASHTGSPSIPSSFSSSSSSTTAPASSFGNAASASRRSPTLVTKTRNKECRILPTEKKKTYYSGTQLLEDVRADYYSAVGGGKENGTRTSSSPTTANAVPFCHSSCRSAPCSPPHAMTAAGSSSWTTPAEASTKEEEEGQGKPPPPMGGGGGYSVTLNFSATATARMGNANDASMEKQTVAHKGYRSFPFHTSGGNRNPLSSRSTRSFSCVPCESSPTSFPSPASSNLSMRVDGQECFRKDDPDHCTPPTSSTPSLSSSLNTKNTAQPSLHVPAVSPITAALYGKLFST